MLMKTIDGLEPADKSEMIAELFTDYNKVKAVIAQPKKNKKAYNYNYSPLDEVLRVIDTAIKDSGTNLSYTFETITGEGKAGTKVYIFSGNGAWLEFSDAMLPVSKNDAQGYGSALTYARRYAISSAFGIASEEDDDAQSISSPVTRRETTRQAAPQRQQQPVKKPVPVIDDKTLKSAEITYEGKKQSLLAVVKIAMTGSDIDKQLAGGYIKKLDSKTREMANEIVKRKLYEQPA